VGRRYLRKVRLGYLKADDKPVCRLWATFADPKRAGTWTREHTSKHTLAGIECRTFTLFAGPRRGKTSEILFEAQRTTKGLRSRDNSAPGRRYKSRGGMYGPEN
jgi:hypothetical protein